VKSASIIGCFAMVCVLSFLVLMTIVQGMELEGRLALAEDALMAIILELERVEDAPSCEGPSLAYAPEPRRPDNIARLRHDVLRLEAVLRQTASRAPRPVPRPGTSYGG
jgi:hypothetical protein